jgi:hypothetical protein
LPEDSTLPTAGSRVACAYAESRERPLALRLARIARPARLRIRRRNPWVFLRRRLFGWKVRFDIDPILFRGERRPGAGEVYETPSSPNKGLLPGRKCVKSHRRTGPVEKSGAIVRGASQRTRRRGPGGPLAFPHGFHSWGKALWIRYGSRVVRRSRRADLGPRGGASPGSAT